MLTSFDGGRLFGQVHGSDAPTVLALHGWRRDHRDWAAVLGGADGRPPSTAHEDEPVLPPDAPLPTDVAPSIALDLPGFGDTPAPETAWGAKEYANAVGNVLDAMSERVVVLGHSFGGRVAVELAASRPDRIAGVVLTGAPLFPAGTGTSKPPLKYRIGKALGRTPLVSPSKLEELKRRYGSADYRAATGVMRDVLVKAIAEERQGAYSGALAAIPQPVELVWGVLDTAAPLRVAEQIERALTGSERVTLTTCPGAGHLTPLLVPGQLRAAVDRLREASSAK